MVLDALGIVIGGAAGIEPATTAVNLFMKYNQRP